MGRATTPKRAGHMMKVLLSLVGVLAAATAVNLWAGRCMGSSCSTADKAARLFFGSSTVSSSSPQNRRIGPTEDTADDDQPLQASLLVGLASGLQQEPINLPTALGLLKQQQAVPEAHLQNHQQQQQQQQEQQQLLYQKHHGWAQDPAASSSNTHPTSWATADGDVPPSTPPNPDDNTQSMSAPPTVDIPGSQFTTRFLQQLLMMANYTQLGAAPFVDPLMAARDLAGMQELMRQQQQLFCSAGLHQLPLNGTQQLEVRGLKLHVYSKADAVADSLKIHQGWEAHVVNQLTWAIQQYKLQFVHYEGVLGRGGLQAAAASYKAPLVVDVGANMGWIMMSAAAQGARVIAFEGMPMNYLLLRRTLCDNPDLMARVTLFAAGLSDRSQDCSVVSLRNNQGNGNVLCGSNPAKSMKELAAREPGVYEVRGTMSLRRLDDLLDEDVHLLKVDVEGWEEAVLQGAARLLAQKRVKYIITEANNQLRSKASLLAFMRFLYASGFNISYHGFQGPFISREQVYNASAPQPSWDVFCVLRGPNQHQAGKVAAVSAGL